MREGQVIRGGVAVFRTGAFPSRFQQVLQVRVVADEEDCFAGGERFRDCCVEQPPPPHPEPTFDEQLCSEDPSQPGEVGRGPGVVVGQVPFWSPRRSLVITALATPVMREGGMR